MVAPVPFSIQQLDRLIKNKKNVIVKKVARNEKYNEKNRQAHREEDRLSQSTSVGPKGKKVDVQI